MSISMVVSRMVIDEKVKEEKEFSLDELLKEITLQGGSGNIAEWITIQDYLDILQKKGIILYNSSNSKYSVVYNLNKDN